MGQKWKSYVKGNEKRQDILETALHWVSRGDADIGELKTYFKTVIDWVDGVFERTKDEMCGLDWGRLYETYHKAVGHAANRTRIYKFAEMDADHVTAWSKGGATDVGNCQMLCKTHNRAKGNR